MLAEEIFDHFAVNAIKSWETEQDPAVMEVVSWAGGTGVFL